ncbi:galactosylceramide sulfotransferase-like [Saccoglossus kowalevskii]|uniref:Galactosylceramide sulfotransferase-like n=1 Tax=Saccoglossus kowalevskii TaxID=10224 RepID=A0ABM0MN62_SACKO|nr:PREDICTED: galactosylceramide sulfotransferase-like [Saccoglossus kowalevskii]
MGYFRQCRHSKALSGICLSLIAVTVIVTLLTDYYWNRTIFKQKPLFATATVAKKQQCEQKSNIVFVKTHKTASTSLHCIFCRYGYTNGLSFVFSKFNTQNGHLRHTPLRQDRLLPPNGGAVVGSPSKYNILTGHVTYSKARIDQLMEDGAKYVTILREPARQIESHANFFGYAGHTAEGIASFSRDPSHFENGGKAGSRNNQIRELGLSLSDTANETIVNKTIHKLNNEFDLVLITEYFEESLILLKKLLCWEFEDIIYLAKNRRLERDEITDEIRQQIYDWSRADFLLYRYFNNTLWKKIREYGSGFKDELQKFRSYLKGTHDTCTMTQNVQINTMNKIKHLEYSTKNQSMSCRHLAKSAVEWFQLIAMRQYPRLSREFSLINRSKDS